MRCILYLALAYGIFFSMPGKLKAQSEDLFDYTNSLKYAKHLLQIRKYEAAAQEYERILYFTPGDRSMQLNLLNSYFLARNFTQGIERAKYLYPQIEQMPSKLAFSYSKLLLLGRYDAELDQFLQNNQQLTRLDKERILMSQQFISGQWESARNLYYNSPHQEQELQIFSPLIQKTASLKRKKPLTALGLSAILPGLGRIYTKQWKDGIVSFALTGSLGYAAYRNFSRNGRGSLLGWLYGGIALGFYTGNLYGSYQSALRYNDRQSGEIIDETTRLVYRHF